MSKTGLKVSVFAAALLSCVHRNPTPVAEEPTALSAKPTTLVCPPGSLCEGPLSALIRKTAVYFDVNRAILTPMSQHRLQEVARLLRKHPATRVEIVGNCDEPGTDEYSLHLGQKRAEAAKKYLAALGVDEARIDTISYGFHKPVDGRHSAKARTNRRDDFRVTWAGVPARSNP